MAARCCGAVMMRAIIVPVVFVACLLSFTGCNGMFDDLEQRDRIEDTTP